MRSRIAAICLAVAATSVAVPAMVLTPSAAQAQSARVSFDLFYNDLANDGRWVDHPSHGWVWYPTRVRADWRPYSEGRWVWTDRHGWYWQSDERFGWATYHYGRWGYDQRYGWIWVPGNEWAPAWVSFRNSDSAIGWAPLPPETLGLTLVALLAGGRSNSYYRYVDMSDSYYQPRWTFVPTRYFTQSRPYGHAVPWRQNVTYIRQTTNVTNYVTVNNYYVNRSIDPRRIERSVGHRIEPVRINQVNDHRNLSSRRDDRTVNIYRPDIGDRDDRRAPPPGARARPQDRPAVTVHQDAVSPQERSRPDRNDRNDRDNNRPDRNDRNDRDNRNDRNDGNDRGGRSDTPHATPSGPDHGGDQNRGADRNDRNDRNDRTGKPDDKTPATRAMPATPPDRGDRNDRTGKPGDNAPATRAVPATPPDRGDRNAHTGKPTDNTPATRAMPATPSNRGGRPDAVERQDRRAMPTRVTPTERTAPPDRGKPERADRPQQRNEPPQRAAPAERAAPSAREQQNSKPAERGRSNNDGCGGHGQPPCR